mmetsp:Transcript_4951/g.20190  ORF Transcript_4951/g.20190 Transcript_4951/m.20190 type:complete len:213 (-) Transcript_4951:461-1099(-)
MSLLPPPLPPLRLSNPAAAALLNLSRYLSSGGVSGAMGNGCGDLASSRLGSLFASPLPRPLIPLSDDDDADAPETEPRSDSADRNEDVDPASDSVGEKDSSSPSSPAADGARTMGSTLGCGFASIASRTIIHSATMPGNRRYDRMRFSTMMDSIFPPKPVIFTTHSPPMCSFVRASVSWLTVIVPSTTARSVMLFTVWNVCVNGNLPFSAST